MKNQKNNKITALYCRSASNDRAERENSSSVESQKAELTAYAKEHGFKNIRFYVDDGYTGTNFDRPGVQRMLHDIENGLVSAVIVKNISRLGRNYRELSNYTKIFFPKNKARFIAVDDGMDSSDVENCKNKSFSSREIKQKT